MTTATTPRSLHRRSRRCSRVPRPAAPLLPASSPASSDVLAMIAHDLRLPLAALRLSSELALDGGAEAAGQQYLLETVHRQVGALERLTLDLLDAFADGGVAPAERCEIDVEALCREVVAEFEAALGGRRTFELRVAAPAQVRGNAAKLRVALRNLVGNAVKYASDGSAVVVEAGCRDGQALIAVRDRGAGIAPEQLGRIFDRFYRVDRRTGHAPGHGLGLFIARQIVAAHGGDIHVASQPGAGSCFTIALPLA